ncbi:hypothetical protein D9M70_600730 [compost metagenome]
MQEEKHDHCHQQNGQEKVKYYRIGRFQRIIRGVIGYFYLQPFLFILLLHPRKNLFGGFTHFYGIGIRLFKHLERDSAFAIYP